MALKPATLIVAVAPALEEAWAASFDDFIGRFRPAAIVLDALSRSNAGLVSKARDAAVALLIKTASADGVGQGSDGLMLLADADQVKLARAKLGSAAIVGAACDLTRHDAMEKAEAGADFILFSAAREDELTRALELCAWWDQVATVPSALEYVPRPLTRQNLEASRPDFVFMREVGEAGESLNFAIEFGLQNSI